MPNILIAEDNPIQRNNLIKMLKNIIIKDINIYEAEDEASALKIANTEIIDFFYIDISLKNSSGLNLGLNLRNIDRYRLSWIVFITTHKQYILPAFKEIHCYDYIIKPYDKQKVKDMTMLIIDDINKKHKKEIKEREYVLFDCNKLSIKVYLEDIFFIEVRIRNVIIHTTKGLYEIHRTSLKNIMKKVCNDYIVQCHRSYLMNLKRIEKIEKYSYNSWIVSFYDYKKNAFIGSKYKDIIDEYMYSRKNKKDKH
ncbi:LytTR family DNA-binding domain-containing protein [Clostridium pasteurianum]|uniref:LytR/AlgR family response regulator transcription factor n=1 Tax=Clostridium pasteurianum TaxID=1501 RepID=UPI002260FB67|nr:LytTR family DNA-binding domain-containing protein [Clostridium pasteurianum]UZW14501.1 LytTR family DNA-binding domain-containing protein [Clostridium pasteurianum]